MRSQPQKLLEASGAPSRSSEARPVAEPADPFGDFTASRAQTQAPLAGIDFTTAPAVTSTTGTGSYAYL